MKTLLLTFITIPVVCFTQVYFPFIDSTAEWRDEYGTAGLYEIEYLDLHHYSFLADTLIDGKSYSILSDDHQKMFSSYVMGGYLSWTAGEIEINRIQYFIREDSLKKVYILGEGIPEQLLYDFDLNTGDTLPLSFINYTENNHVISIDSILINGNYHKRFNIGDYDTPYASIIEGVGSTYGLLNQLVPPFEFYSQLICYTMQGETTQFEEEYYGIIGIDDNLDDCDLIYVDVDEYTLTGNSFSIYPNPAFDQISIEWRGQAENGTIRLINNSGQTVFFAQLFLLNSSSNRVILPALIPGIYSVQIITEKSTVCTPIVIN